MKHIKHFLLAAAVIFAAARCTDDKPAKRAVHRPSLDTDAPSIRIKMPGKDAIYYGDTIRMEVEPVTTGPEIKEVTAELVDAKKVIARSADGMLAIPTTLSGGGDFQLRIKATFKDGKESSRYKLLQVLAAEKPENWHFEVVNRYPHDSQSYTQGLVVHDGYVYEGTGTYGGSHLRKLDLKTGKVLLERKLPDAYFGEGIAIYQNKIYQLTYKAGKGFIYDLKTFDPQGEFSYNFLTSEGWGLTSHDSLLIASDGSEMLYFIHPEDFSVTGMLRVFDQNGSVTQLNELEYHNGKIYANIYTTARIVAIDPLTGRVTDNYTASGIMLKSEATPNMDVLNGIAFNPLNGNFLITGKNWSRLYEARPLRFDV